MTRAASGSEQSTGDNAYEHVAGLFDELVALPRGDPRRAELRDRLVEGYLPVAKHIARRFAQRGEPLDDLEQVATLGLINAVDRFEPDRGSDFLSYAVPTITGEVRRHFRDQAWAMHVPRRLKELRATLAGAHAELSQRRGQAPTASELAQYVGIPREEVVEGLAAASAYRGTSLDGLLAGDDRDRGTMADVIGAADRELDRVEYRATLQPLLAELPERERTIVMLRFFGNLTQTQIAERVGISQMHVSRLLTQTLRALREAMARH